ncbi:DUF4132 domain-containing protein [Paractinoplanes lichenicola]|uniref:DUF4132 domain-containing protein n=1 Tax=Paractinoplanes lichenicola TaxID=2802976 RepID=A0ABS1VHV7_9ACTN|nr:DUF4132 domain-containing protein [Actinoplanes lichenicola]MBL7254253.1 DUF4132 domain-containing protein [Actinoplanes lichenicola]
MGWVPAGTDYEISVDQGKVVARKGAGGKPLKSLPKALKDHEAVVGLRQLVEWLRRHDASCRGEVERWMVRSLPVPAGVIAQVWADETWRAVLHDAVVVPLTADGEWDVAAAGLLRDADPATGLGVVDLDGESARITATAVAIPHPVRLPDLDDLREFAADLGVEQGLLQLFREIWRPGTEAERRAELRRYAGARYKELRHVQSRATSAGYRVQGGTAVCRVWEGGTTVVASVWIGDGDPGVEASTSELSFADASGDPIAAADVPPVAWSEGMRMAATLHAGRVADEEGDR